MIVDLDVMHQSQDITPRQRPYQTLQPLRIAPIDQYKECMPWVGSKVFRAGCNAPILWCWHVIAATCQLTCTWLWGNRTTSETKLLSITNVYVLLYEFHVYISSCDWYYLW